MYGDYITFYSISGYNKYTYSKCKCPLSSDVRVQRFFYRFMLELLYLEISTMYMLET